MADQYDLTPRYDFVSQAYWSGAHHAHYYFGPNLLSTDYVDGKTLEQVMDDQVESSVRDYARTSKACERAYKAGFVALCYGVDLSPASPEPIRVDLRWSPERNFWRPRLGSMRWLWTSRPREGVIVNPPWSMRAR